MYWYANVERNAVQVLVVNIIQVIACTKVERGVGALEDRIDVK
jgi:hypothetical protein